MDSAGISPKHDGRSAIECLLQHLADPRSAWAARWLLNLLRQVNLLRHSWEENSRDDRSSVFHLSVKFQCRQGRHRSVCWAHVFAILSIAMGADVHLYVVGWDPRRQRPRLCTCRMCMLVSSQNVRGQLANQAFWNLTSAEQPVTAWPILSPDSSAVQPAGNTASCCGVQAQYCCANWK